MIDEAASRFVLEPDAIGLLRQYEIPYPDHGLAHSAEEARQIADRVGYPVVLKVVSPDVVHKSDAGGVAMDLEASESVPHAFRMMVHNVQAAVPGARINGALVCRQAPPGQEVIVGALDEKTFGPTVMFGLGGIYTEVLKDVSFKLVPLERRDAEEMVRETRAYSLLAGARGRTGGDVNAVVELLLSVSRMVADRPQIEELDLNPVRVFEEGLLVLDVRLLEKGGESS